jgi:hypothetical protein
MQIERAGQFHNVKLSRESSRYSTDSEFRLLEGQSTHSEEDTVLADFRLWTPVANALEVYRRRILSEPGAVYEHIWRLIHVHEAMVVTLGSALASRLLSAWYDKPETEDSSKLNELRLRITGVQPDGTMQGDSCLAGSIEAWVQLLERFAKVEVLPECPFCTGLATYLCEGPQGHLSFLEAWKRIAPVPSVAERDALSRVDRFRAINQLRNKLAHVPLPTRLLAELHKGLRSEVLAALSPRYDSSKDSPSEDFAERVVHPPLRGRVLSGDFICTGTSVRGRGGEHNGASETVRLQSELSGEGDGPVWVGDPFFSVDAECKVSLLFRIRSDMDISSDFFVAEYHRFAAEFEPVNGKEICGRVMKPWLEFSVIQAPKPATPAEDGREDNGICQRSDKEDTENLFTDAQDPDVLRSIAEEACLCREYGRAIAAFDKLAQTGDRFRYNDVAKLHHGKSLWRYGYASTDFPEEERVQAIQSAVKVLQEASGHTDVRYSAQAWYEMSKAYHKLWKLTGDGYFDEAYQAAEEAAKLDYQAAYITWIERLDQERELEAVSSR